MKRTLFAALAAVLLGIAVARADKAEDFVNEHGGYAFLVEYLTSTRWQQYTLSGQFTHGSRDWIIGSGTGNIPHSQTPTYFAGYTCQRSGGAWKCGCADSACISPKWQLQEVAQSQNGNTTTVSVRDTGARGDGVTDDTAAIQAAVNQVGDAGGTVLVPDGTYMIDAITSIHLKSNMTFKMASGATLKAKPNSAKKYAIIEITSASDVKVVGGTLFGDRDTHSGTTGEWGMGININNSNHILIEAVTAKNCWGDGFYVGTSSSDITFSSVTADYNRRQGISITWADGVVIRNSVFKNTQGTAPQSGLDLEPNETPGGHVSNVHIISSQFLNNYGRGINFNGTASYPVTNVTIDSNTISGNFGGIYFRNLQQGHTITHNMITDSNKYGISLDGNTGNTIIDNTITVSGSAEGRAIVGNHGGNTIH